ncbi:MAG: hypothetical protein GXO91_09560 [FCB group bacterium]|nr:hypothetical protein [FCB group bacterium]
MKPVCSKTMVLFLVLFAYQTALADVHHGASVGITNNGTGFNYILAYNYSAVLQYNISAGLHFERKEINYVIYDYGIAEDTKKLVTYLPVSLGISKVLFDNALAGSFRPLITVEAGFITGLGRLGELTSQAYDFSPQWSVGPGIQFGYGKSKTLVVVAYTSNDKIDGAMLIKFTVFWK